VGVKRETDRERETETEREKTSEMPNSSTNWRSQSPEKIVSQEWIQAKRRTNSQRSQSRTIALLYPFLSHCLFSHINHLFQFEIPPCQFVSSPARAWQLISAVPYLSIRVSYDEHIALFIYIPFRSFVLSPYQTSNELLASRPPPNIIVLCWFFFDIKCVLRFNVLTRLVF
jgi:hypothetical protein